MAQKKSFVLRINPETLRELEKWAEDEFRSVNGQIEYLLMKALKENGREPNIKKEEEDSKSGNKDT